MASAEVEELDRRIAAFQASLVELETEITDQETLCTTIQSRIAGATGKQQVYDDALAAVGAAPRSTEDERAERRSLRDDADEARADLVMTQDLLQGAKSTLVNFRTRKDTLTQHVATATAEKGKLLAAQAAATATVVLQRQVLAALCTRPKSRLSWKTWSTP